MQTCGRADRLVRRHAGDEWHLNRVDVAESGDVALVEQGRRQSRHWVSLQSLDHLVDVGDLGSAQIRAEMVGDTIFVRRRQHFDNRKVDPRQSAAFHPQFDASPPFRLSRRGSDGPRSCHPQMGMQCRPIVKADEQVLADGIGIHQRRSS